MGVNTISNRQNPEDASNLQAFLSSIVRQAMSENMITITQLADRVGMRRGYISNLIGLRARGSLMAWSDILQALNIELGWRQKS